MRRNLKRQPFTVAVDGDFEAVVRSCADRRSGGVWLSEALIAAYIDLHRAGVAHSVECRQGGDLAGGLFGVALGAFFSSESMFHRVSDAGNQTLVATHALLRDARVTLWDIQMVSPHTRRFGAVEISQQEYLKLLHDALAVGSARFP